MIDEPGWRAGRLISYKPAFGPDAIIRKSFAIFDMLIIQIFKAEEISVYVSVFCVPSTRFSEDLSLYPEILHSSSNSISMYFWYKFYPVLTSVIHIFITILISIT